MGLNKFRELIDARMKRLDDLIDLKVISLKNVPEGILYVSGHGKYPQFYSVDANGAKTYISKENLDMIRKMAQRDYDREILKLAIKEKRQLERLRRGYPKAAIEEYYETLCGARKEMVKPILLTDQEYVKKWEEESFESKESDDSEFAIITNKGERVRSKSEKMIADKLAQLGIPYRYEAKLVLPDGTIIHPDFTLLDVRRHREVYLEHFGKMDDADYSSNFVRRIRLYERSGIVLGDRLLATFESYKIPLDVTFLENLVAKLLP